MVIRVSDKKKNYSKVTKLLVKPTFKKSNVEDLKEKLQDACEHPEKVNELKAQASDFICAKYNWDVIVDETIKLYGR